MKSRRLKGHTAALTCCVAARSRPGVIASAGEDGRVCWFDLRCKDSSDAALVFSIEVDKEPVSSLCFKSGNEDVLYAAAGARIMSFDVRVAPAWKTLESYNCNKEEINQIAFSPNSYFLAAADDSGDVKIIDTRQQCLYKTLRSVHTSICSSVQFLPWNPWSAVTGGLDSKLAMWDFSKGRSFKVVDYGMPQVDAQGSSSSVGQCFNPAFVHSLAVPDMDMVVGLKKVCAVARGDGVVDVIEVESEPSLLSKNSSHHKKSLTRSKDAKKQAINDHMVGESQGERIQLDYALGGHTAAVSCVTFSQFGERGRFLISGGNDASVKLWDWSKHFQNMETSCNTDVVSNININKKVNWLCTTPSDSENLILCDTSKVLKVYTLS